MESPLPTFFFKPKCEKQKKIARGFEVGQKQQEKLVISLLKLLEKKENDPH